MVEIDAKMETFVLPRRESGFRESIHYLRYNTPEGYLSLHTASSRHFMYRSYRSNDDQSLF